MLGQTEKWAIILGGTGCIGLSTAKNLSNKDFNLILIYRERKACLKTYDSEINLIKSKVKLIEFNVNANIAENQNKIIETLIEDYNLKNKISFLLNAIADGNLNPMFKTNQNISLSQQDISHTIESMGTSLYLWTKLLFENNLFANKASVVGLTSEGARMIFKDYAAVAAAKAVMESNIRYIAIELAKFGIRANLVNAGITNSKALEAFPEYKSFLEKAKSRNPNGRLTKCDDIAKVLTFLASDDSVWINGSTITVDGGEQLISVT
jgi:enoyl-[acyl-carrier protein] reductase III